MSMKVYQGTSFYPALKFLSYDAVNRNIAYKGIMVAQPNPTIFTIPSLAIPP